MKLMMTESRDLWLLKFQVAQSYAEEMASLFNEDALSITVLAPPRVENASLEVIYPHQPNKQNLISRLSIQASLLGISIPEFELERIADINWVDWVATEYKPRNIGLFRITPSNELSMMRGPGHSLTIPASSAFGTGDHPTTEGCLLMLDSLIKHGHTFERVLDVGCGSGILALAAAKALKVKTYGVEIDPLSVGIAINNCRINGLSTQTQIIRGNGFLGAKLKRVKPFNLIFANIFARPLALMAPTLKNFLAPRGMVILAGLLTTQENLVLSAYRRQNIYPYKRKIIGEWSVLILQQKLSA